jgi:putative FmdB family regulatory protein
MPASAGGLREGGSVPTYQYTCTDCGDQIEAVQKFTDAPLSLCAACGGRLRKVFSPVGIVFKGSGFYRTDSRNGSSAATKDKRPGEAASPAPSDPGSGGNGSPAAKPAENAGAPAKSPSSDKAA